MSGRHVLVLLAIASASCSLDASQKTACFSSADCLNGWMCVSLRCERKEASTDTGCAPTVIMSMDASAGHRDASGDHPDASPESRDASADRPDGSAGHQDGLAEHHDGSAEHHDGSAGHQGDSGNRQDSAADRGPDASSGRDGGADSGTPRPPVQGSCDEGTVSECSTQPATSQCQQTFCGGRIWGRGGQSPLGNIPYRIRDPNGLFSDAYKAAIRAGAAAWTSATHGLITFSECSNCPSRLVSVVPGSADGVDDSGGWEQLMPLPVGPAGSDIPWHRIAHQWGHVIGLDDMYRRPDRDRYATFDPAVWCSTGASLPATCAFSDPTQQPGSPPVASGTFGAYDELSVMNGLPSQGICGNVTADQKSVQPTLGDVSAVEELYYSVGGSWSPFQPIARSTGAHAPPDYQLATGVDPIGGPAIADWTGLPVDIAVRGTDGNVYETWNDLAGTTFVGWAPWRVIADHVNSDPALVFAGPTTLYLAVRSAVDGTIRLRTRTNGEWGPWASLGAPAVGAASAPAIAALDTQPPTVFVRGGDNLIYHFNCVDPATMCAISAAAADAWMPLHPPDVGQFVGKPSANWQVNGGGYLFVSAIGSDRQAWIIGGQTPDTLGDWLTEGINVSPEDPDPGVALATTAAAPLDFFTRNEDGLLLFKIDGDSPIEIGGIPISTPAAVGAASADVRLNVAAVIEDHGHPGVWWRVLSPQYTPPCNYNAPGTCAQCGCGLPGTPPCNF